MHDYLMLSEKWQPSEIDRLPWSFRKDVIEVIKQQQQSIKIGKK